MKLTRKGLLKIVGDIVVDSPEYPLSKTLDNWNRTRDFDQDDFEGVVCLTVEEANLLFSVIDGFFDLRLPTTKEIVALNKLKVRVERIKQVSEKK